jgi:glycosyltransferase involved in cell wall biosynthesis
VLPRRAPERFFLRERFIKAQLALVDRFVCPSRFLADRFVAWGLPADRVLVEEYGRAVAPAPATPARTPPLRVGFFGQLSPFKGVDVLLEAALLLERRGTPVEIALHGSHLDLQSPAFRARFDELLRAVPSVRLHGAYGPDDLDALMGDVDWVVVPSVWWENSPLVIQRRSSVGARSSARTSAAWPRGHRRSRRPALPRRRPEALAATIARGVTDPGCGAGCTMASVRSTA